MESPCLQRLCPTTTIRSITQSYAITFNRQRYVFLHINYTLIYSVGRFLCHWIVFLSQYHNPTMICCHVHSITYTHMIGDQWVLLSLTHAQQILALSQRILHDTNSTSSSSSSSSSIQSTISTQNHSYNQAHASLLKALFKQVHCS